MALTPAEQAAQDAGWSMPAGVDLISNGDDAIRANAAKVYREIISLYDEIDRARYPGTRIRTADSGIDVFGLESGKVYSVTSTQAAEGMLNMPENQPGQIIVDGHPDTTTKLIEFHPHNRDYYYRTVTRNADGDMMPWIKVDLSSQSGVSLPHAIRQAQMMTALGGPIDTEGRGAVAFRVDHGLANFKSKLLPLFRAAEIVPMLALNSRSWGNAENAGVTQTEVNQWVADGWVEISNHGAHHGDATDEAGILDTIQGGLNELADQLPAAAGNIWGFSVAGVGGTGLQGFGSGSSPEAWATYAGRTIAELHAFGTGYLAGTSVRPLDGTIRDGLSHITMDSASVSALRSRVDEAITTRGGAQFMIHPSLLDTEGRITTAQFGQVLDYIVQQRTAGALMTLSSYEMMVADSTRPTPAVADVTGLPDRLAALEYDSGERDITGLLTNIVSGRLLLERTGPWVSLNFQELVTDLPSGEFASWNSVLPVGFRPSSTSSHIDLPLAPRLATTTQGSVRISRFGEIRIYRLGGVTTGVAHFKTHDAPPSTLPGTPA